MTLINTKRFDIVLCSVLLPERFSVKTPCTLGIQFNGILQSRLHYRFLFKIPKASSGYIVAKYITLQEDCQ